MYSRCPKCKAKTVRSPFQIYCRRCGWSIGLEMDNISKRFWFG